jgi:hypothetical protein
MTDLPRKYIVDENNKRIAVQLDIATFERIEEVLENYGLAQLIKESEEEEKLSVGEAKTFYQALDKAE